MTPSSCNYTAARRWVAAVVGTGVLCGLAVGAPAALALPSDYVYEMVSPSDKQGGSTFSSGFGGGSVSIDGDRVAFASANAFAGQEGSGLILWYGSTRTEGGWVTRPMMPRFTALPTPFGDTSSVGPASEDMSKVLVCTNSDPVTGELSPRRNLYLRDNDNRTYTQLTSDPVAGGVGQLHAGP